MTTYSLLLPPTIPTDCRTAPGAGQGFFNVRNSPPASGNMDGQSTEGLNHPTLTESSLCSSQPAGGAEEQRGRSGAHTQRYCTTLVHIFHQGDKELVKPVLRRFMKGNYIDYPRKPQLSFRQTMPSSKAMFFLARPRICLNCINFPDFQKPIWFSCSYVM